MARILTQEVDSALALLQALDMGKVFSVKLRTGLTGDQSPGLIETWSSSSCLQTLEMTEVCET